MTSQMKSSTQTMLSPKQREHAERMFGEAQEVPFYMFPYCGRNKASWKLVAMGLAEFDFGPRGAWLQTYCFMPLWSDPVC